MNKLKFLSYALSGLIFYASAGGADTINIEIHGKLPTGVSRLGYENPGHGFSYSLALIPNLTGPIKTNYAIGQLEVQSLGQNWSCTPTSEDNRKMDAKDIVDLYISYDPLPPTNGISCTGSWQPRDDKGVKKPSKKSRS